jgi:hypothetical protein
MEVAGTHEAVTPPGPSRERLDGENRSPWRR